MYRFPFLQWLPIKRLHAFADLWLRARKTTCQLALFWFVCLHSINRVTLPHTIVTSHADTS